MKNISDGLQAVAGNRLRRMISLVTDNRLLAVGVGTLVTMIVQSSSITTVLVVGLVNSGFMSLTQAIGVVFGANIGTTITGWVLVLKIGKYGLPLAGASAFGYLFISRDRLRYLCMGAMGVGMVFFGLELMKDGFSIIKDLPAFEQWFERFTADSYIGVLKCAAIGCILTFIVQSSSATLGITIGLAQIGVIPFQTAAALVLGENIGTTITAWLASFGTSPNA
ncbi:MAG TPA: Na/Pi cotransporter family protein, partial [Planctomycetaceae bacterium]|nr:Na/Pi cotransporter family protein [Planctomycetaceae bacterium]